MDKQFEILTETRKHLLGLVADLSIDQFNKVPEGFSNNIAWNIGHMIASEQGVCYRRGGLPLVVDKKYFETYKPGTKPAADISIHEMETLKELLLSTIEKLKTDYNDKLFVNYVPWTTRYGVQLSSIDETINFLVFHDGLHCGYIMALKHLVS